MQLVYISIFFVLSIFLTIYLVKHFYLGLNNRLLYKENSNLKEEISCLREKYDDFLKDITRLEKISYQEGIEEGRIEGREEGEKIGKDAMGEAMSKLIKKLLEDGNIEEVRHVTSNSEYRDKLLKELGLL